MSDESTLRQTAREALQAGKLPNRSPHRTWGGPGAGATCEICGRPVKHNEVEFELEFAGDDDDPGRRNYIVHTRCFAAWERERQNWKVAAETIANSGKAVGLAILPGASHDDTMIGCERDTTYRRGPV